MATHVVTGDQYREIDRRMNEIKRQLNQPAGSPLGVAVIEAVMGAAVALGTPAPEDPRPPARSGRPVGERQAVR